MISAGSGFGSSSGGMVVYYSGLLRALCELPSVSQVVAFVSPWNEGLAVPDHPKVRVVTCRGLPSNRLGRVGYEQTVLPYLAGRAGVDAFLSTCNTKPLLARRPSVVVLQSVQFMHFPEQFSPLRRAYLRHTVKLSLHAADRVITVSEWERQEAIRLFGVDPSRVHTVYHGLSDEVRDLQLRAVTPERLAIAGDGPYAVMVSSLYGFKNHRRLVQAFARAVSRHHLPHRLVLAGGDADVTRGDLAALAAELGVGDRVRIVGPVPHDQVPALIAHADAVAYVSLYETFGHPVIEALAAGRPLLTSNHGAMAEIAGDAARLVDAESVESIADGLADVLLDRKLQERLVTTGVERASRFTWERCAEQTATVIQEAIAGHKPTRLSRLLPVLASVPRNDPS